VGERKTEKSIRGIWRESWETAVVMWGVDIVVAKMCGRYWID
jgi:hypothetical protein